MRAFIVMTLAVAASVGLQEGARLNRQHLLCRFAVSYTLALNHLMADDFVGINPLGQHLTKAQTDTALTSSDYEIESLQNEDINVHVFDDTAIATARGIVRGKFKGQDASGQFIYTRVWLKRRGSWQAVAAHSSNSPEKQP